MRKCLFVFQFVILVSPSSAFGQQHAPTLEMCKADVAVWYDDDTAADYNKQETKHITDGMPNTNEYNKLRLSAILKRINEMSDCYKVAGFQKLYIQASNFYVSIMSNRMQSFIIRHHLWEQFKKEDAAGLR